jgi:hypothetical protein
MLPLEELSRVFRNRVGRGTTPVKGVVFYLVWLFPTPNTWAEPQVRLGAS